MKVLLVNKLYYPVIGGVETVVRDLARYLPEDVDRKVLVASETRRGNVSEIDGIEVIKTPSLGIFKSTPLPPTFPFYLKKFEKWADIFHFHFPFPPGELSFLLAGIKKPLVVTYHSDIVRQRFLLKFYEPFLIKFLERAEKIIATSPNYIETSPYLCRFKDKCEVIPLGIDIEKLKLTSEVENKALEIRKRYGTPIVLFVGRLIYYKGVECLVRAMKDVKGTLILVGTGPLYEKLRSLASELDISERTVFLPHLEYEDLVSMYYACDVFCLPSIERSEAFGIVQLEAQACGKPVVSTELGTGTSYANLDGVTGFVVPPRDEKALSKALNKLLSDENLRKKLGEQAKQRVAKEFEVRMMAARTNQVYLEVLDSKKLP